MTLVKDRKIWYLNEEQDQRVRVGPFGRRKTKTWWYAELYEFCFDKRIQQRKAPNDRERKLFDRRRGANRCQT